MDTRKNIIETIRSRCGKFEIREEDIFLYDLGLNKEDISDIISILIRDYGISISGSSKQFMFASVADFCDCARTPHYEQNP